MSDLRFFHGPNAGYVLGLYEQFRTDPASLDESWRGFFASFDPASLEAVDGLDAAGSAAGSVVDVATIVGAHELAEAIRARGHTAARLSPLGDPADPDPALRPEAHGITHAQLEQLPASVVRGPVSRGARNAREAVERLYAMYSGTVGYEFEHIIVPEEREWLREAVESRRFHAPFSAEQKKAVLRRLSQVEGFEKYLHKAFFGQKRFSLEGTDTMVPVLDTVIQEAARAGVCDVVIGMAHRGRLNVLAHVLEKPYSMMIGGFVGGVVHTHPLTEEDFTGDVKYHMGWRHAHKVDGREVRITLSPNPSHLEFVHPVIVGMARAAQDDTSPPGQPSIDHATAVAIQVHGDGAFPGQGVVAETLNMSQIEGYCVGGSIHLIVNNQIGFTTLPQEDRSTRYASDPAKGFEIPIAHVNADDADACIAVARLAYAYRLRYRKDFVIDLVGYRRWGHNEGDEPAFTQPRMYETIRTLPTARDLWVKQLIEAGTVTQEEADGMLQEVMDALERVHTELQEKTSLTPRAPADIQPKKAAAPIDTSVPVDRLLALNEVLLARPQGFTPNSRLSKLLERRREVMGEDGGIDWGHAETLAFASLLEDGIPVRLTGQDSERGTFSHRHLVLHDSQNGARYNVLNGVPNARASFAVYNSPLSEMAVVGFEYGYSVFDPEVLVIWEAQFGDFSNGAQVIIDQFISAAYQKWGQRSGLILLLPHGYEGQGPEHSSARLERFLQLAGDGSMRVVNCTTSAQYFHLLRRQAAKLGTDPRPLIVMSPKSLLRHPLAASRMDELANGSFQTVLGDTTVDDRLNEVTRLLLCTGKVYVDLVGSDLRESARNVALTRVEELFPFPAETLRQQIERFPNLREIVWVQEEPKNMGAWSFAFPRLLELAGESLAVRYEGRPFRASPAEGFASQHNAEQSRIVRAAWEGAAAPAAERKARRA
jgi:2-oxoglutarate dehydrogenase E1 component